jgi:diguanylate cyclase (GGDEF)-like protein/PAS domain S-box-containing protein
MLNPAAPTPIVTGAIPNGMRSVKEELMTADLFLTNMVDGGALFDADLRLIISNESYRDILALPALVAGDRLEQIWRQAVEQGIFAAGSEDESIDDVIADWSIFFNAADPVRRELPLGDGRWFLVGCQPWRQGDAGGFLMLLSDITAQKRRELELVEARLLAEERVRDLERYSGDVEEARRRVESQAADYVGLMEELAAQSETQRAHAATQLKEEQLRRMTDRLPVLVADVDAGGIYRYCNDRYLDFFDRSAIEVIGQHISHVYGEEAYTRLRPDLDQVLAGKEISFRRSMLSHGETRQLEGRYIPQMDAAGAAGGFYVAAWDVTEQYRRELELDREVKTDVLTGLLNRRALMESLAVLARDLSAAGEAAAQSALRGDPVEHGHGNQPPAAGAVMYLDIDHFKQINDTLGHAAGDHLLKIFAQRLRGTVRSSDRVARFGGDEFVVLLIDIGSPQNAERVAQKIIDRMREPIGLDGRMIEIGTSIGVAHSHGQQVTPDFLLQEADAALYEAKKAGRGTFRLHLIQPMVELA